MKKSFHFFLFISSIIFMNIWTVEGQSIVSICKTAHSIDEENVIASTSDGEFAILTGPEIGWYSIYTIVEDTSGKKAAVFMLAGGTYDLRSFYSRIKDHFPGEYGSGCLLSSADLYMLIIKGESVNGKVKLKLYDTDDNYIGSTKKFTWKELEEIFRISLKSIEGELLAEKTNSGKEFLLLNSRGINTDPYFSIDITGQTTEIFSKINRYLINSSYGADKNVAAEIGSYKDKISGEEFNLSVVAEPGSFALKFRSIDDIYISDSFGDIDEVRYLFY